MSKYSIVLLFVLTFAMTSVSAQKVKYKDIYALLANKQYEQAEPFLRKYLKDNLDNPNAYLFMGLIFQDKAARMDVLKQTDEGRQVMDSAIMNFSKALGMIDEKQVRKNKEYYEAYNRRDLRTGEFGVKLSDIQFDIQKRVESLRERADRMKMIKYYFVLSDSMYQKAQGVYRQIQEKFPSSNKMYLRADESTVRMLTSLQNKFDSSMKAFDNYLSSSSNMGKTGYNHQLTLQEITDFKGQGGEQANFFEEDLKLWDYKSFAESVRQTLQKELFPIRENLISYDIEINKLRERLNTDSVSVRNDLTKLVSKLIFDQLKKYDESPLPIDVFAMKVADLEYRSSLMEHRRYKDSLNVHLQLKLVNEELHYLNKLDSTSGRLANQDIDTEATDYEHFITNTYSNTLVLKSYISALKEYAEREKRRKATELEQRQGMVNWLVDGADSIPLQNQITSKSFRSLFIQDERFVVGLQTKDTVNSKGFFYMITPSRKAAVKYFFPVEATSFKYKDASSAKALAHSDGDGQVYYLLFVSTKPTPTQKYKATIAKIYRSDGLAWSNNFEFAFVPESLSFAAETGELSVKSSNAETVVDKNGKLIR